MGPSHKNDGGGSKIEDARGGEFEQQSNEVTKERHAKKRIENRRGQVAMKSVVHYAAPMEWESFCEHESNYA